MLVLLTWSYKRANHCSLQATGTVYDIEECFVQGRCPAVTDHVASVDMEWCKDTNDEMRTASDTNFIWALRLSVPRNLEKLSLQKF